jgi:hypothetical protein
MHDMEPCTKLPKHNQPTAHPDRIKSDSSIATNTGMMLFAALCIEILLLSL